MLTFDDIRGVGVSRMMMSAFFFKIKAVNKTGGQGLTLDEATFYLHFPISKTMADTSAAF